MCINEIREFIMDFLVSIQTMVAIIISIVINRLLYRIKLTVEAIIKENSNSDINSGDKMIITITNIRPRTATITHIYWETGFLFNKEKFKYQGAHRLCVQINDGETTNDEQFACNLISHIYTYFQKLISDNNPEKMAQSINICVKISTGKTFKKRIHKGLQDYLVQMAKQYRINKSYLDEVQHP
jgi:hypothetical protein